MLRAAIRRTATTAGIATLLLAQLAGGACGQVGAPHPAARASSPPARGDDWRFLERNELPSAAPSARVTTRGTRQQDWRFLERNELPDATQEVTPPKGPR